MRGRPAARRCGYWKAKGSWRISLGSATTCADAPAAGPVRSGAASGVDGHIPRMYRWYTFRVLLMYLRPWLRSSWMEERSRWHAGLPVPEVGTDFPVHTFWSSANLMVNCAFGYVSVSSD